MPVDPSVAVFVIFSVILVMYPLWQALGRRSVDGVISDPQGRPVGRALVKLTNLRTSDVRPCRTDPEGRFHFEGLSTMTDYEIAIEQDERLSDPVRVWQSAYHSQFHLQFEPAPGSKPAVPLMVVREGIANPRWWPEFL